MSIVIMVKEPEQFGFVLTIVGSIVGFEIEDLMC